MTRYSMENDPSKTRVSERLYGDEFSFRELREHFDKLQESEENILDADLSIHIELDDYEDHYNFYISGVRDSTDKEKKQWQAILDRNNKFREANEKQHYLALKKKFEGKDA